MIKHGEFYRIFSSLEHAKSFCRGEVRFSTLKYYREIEDPVRVDRAEGGGHARVAGERLVVDLNNEMIISVPGEENLRIQTNPEDHYICCLSKNVSDADVVSSKFGNYAVVVGSMESFVDDIRNGLNAHSELKRFGAVVDSDMVCYDKGELRSGLTFEQEQRLAWLQKPEKYEPEHEYRIHFHICFSEMIGSPNVVTVQLPHQVDYIKLIELQAL